MGIFVGGGGEVDVVRCVGNWKLGKRKESYSNGCCWFFCP